MAEKITLNAMKQIVKNNTLEKVDFTFGETTIILNPNLSFSEKSIFIDRVTNSCFTDDGEFLPEYVDLMTFITLIQMCSNVPVPKKDDMLDLKLGYEWLKATDLLNKIYKFGYEEKTTDTEYKVYQWFTDLEDCISNKIEFKKQQIIHKSPLNDLLNNVNNLVSEFSGKFDMDSVKELIPLLSKLGENFNQEDIVNVILKQKENDITFTSNEEPRAEVSI